MDYFISRFNSFLLGARGITEGNFLSHVKKKYEHSPGSKTLMICLPGWGGKLERWKILQRLVVNQKISFLSYEFPRGIFSDQKELTKNLFGSIDSLVRKEIIELKNRYGFKKCILVCISLASSYGSLIYKDNSDINEIVLVAPGANLAKEMWYGCRTQHFRKSYERHGVTEMQLIGDWCGLASQNNFPAPGARVNIFLGTDDKVIPYKFSHNLANIYKAHNVNVVDKILPLGHYFLISFFLLFPKYFLKHILVKY